MHTNKVFKINRTSFIRKLIFMLIKTCPLDTMLKISIHFKRLEKTALSVYFPDNIMLLTIRVLTWLVPWQKLR